jgi:hypothetical protein
VAILIHGSPEAVATAMNREKYLIQMLLIPRRRMLAP